MQQTAAAMWQDYLFLTCEMAKFLEQKDMELVFELLRQREVLQKTIEALDDQVYHHTDEGRKTLTQAYEENERVLRRMQFALNNAKQTRSAINSYENSGDFIGGRINRST